MKNEIIEVITSRKSACKVLPEYFNVTEEQVDNDLDFMVITLPLIVYSYKDGYAILDRVNIDIDSTYIKDKKVFNKMMSILNDIHNS